jgi:mRNA interferase YafQ
MRLIKEQGQFKRDYKRELKGRYKETLGVELGAVLLALANDVPLIDKYRDHAMSGTWAGFHNCHIRSDLVLLYRKTEEGELHLVRLGSHAELRL